MVLDKVDMGDDESVHIQLSRPTHLSIKFIAMLSMLKRGKEQHFIIHIRSQRLMSPPFFAISSLIHIDL